MIRSSKSSLAIVALALFAAPAWSQTIWHVDASAAPPGAGTSTSPFATIGQALTAPNLGQGDTILVRPGTYAELLEFPPLDVVLASSHGPEITVIDGTGLFSLEQSVVRFRAGQGPSSVLAGFTVRGGEGSLVVEPSTGASWFVGGGVLVLGASPTIRDCVIQENEADAGGALYAEDSALRLVDTVVRDNESLYFGGGLHLYRCEAELVGVRIESNRALAQNGGGVHALEGTLSLEGCTLRDNRANNGGGGGNLALFDGASVTAAGTRFEEGFCLDGNGGAVLAEGGIHAFTDCRFADNSAGDGSSDRDGGALAVLDASLTLARCDLVRNESARGGALFLGDAVGSISDTRFEDNGAASTLIYFFTEGGAVAAEASTLLVERCDFVRNEAVNRGTSPYGTIARGGALWCDAPTVVIEESRFHANRALYDGPADRLLLKDEPGAQGGALFGPLVVQDSLFTRNAAIANHTALIGRCEGGAIFGAFYVDRSIFVANAVSGVGPIPDRGPAIETAVVVDPVLRGNLPDDLPPLGPHVSVAGAARKPHLDSRSSR